MSFFSASKAAIDIMPTPEPIATPVPVNAQRERIESDAYIAVEELIFFSITLVSFFFLCVINERETRERERMKRIHSSAPKTFVVYIILFEKTFPRVRAFCLRGVPTRTRRSLVSGAAALAASRGSRRRSVFLFLFAVILFYSFY